MRQPESGNYALNHYAVSPLYSNPHVENATTLEWSVTKTFFLSPGWVTLENISKSPCLSPQRVTEDIWGPGGSLIMLRI